MATIYLDTETQGQPWTMLTVNPHEKILTRLFEQVEPAFRAHQIEAYERMANLGVKHYVEKLLALDGIEDKTEASKQWHLIERNERPRYMKYRDGSMIHWLDSYIKGAKEGAFLPDLKSAQYDANALVDSAKTHFVSKLTKKLDNALKNCTKKPKLSGELRFVGRIVGWLDVKVGYSGFRVEMSMITNYRYSGRGSTIFHQFPARFTEIIEDKVKIKKSASEAWMAEYFSDRSR